MEREYTAEFKEEAVKLFKERGEVISQIARDLGINPSVLGKWIKKYDEKKSAVNAFPGMGSVAPYDKERVSKRIHCVSTKKKLYREKEIQLES